jgi:electron transfer flavoprotein alpha/beta subunit
MVSKSTEERADTAMSLGVDRGVVIRPPQQGHALVLAVFSIF